MKTTPPIRVALYGSNGHQIYEELRDNPRARLVAAAGIERDAQAGLDRAGVRLCDDLDSLARDDGIDLISLCSPVRGEQAADAVRCLSRGKHVYAEKPCALSERALDDILAAARRSGALFHEMAGTTFIQPYLSMRGIVRSGALGDIVQVYAQKSYPYHDGRPQDEDESIDGGLLRQAGVHAMRFIEHTACARIAQIRAVETRLGNPKRGGMRTACSCMMTLENGGVASAVINYENPRGFGSWGNECLRMFGTKGLLEATDGGARTRLVLGDKDLGSIEIAGEGLSYFELFLDQLLEGKPMPLSLEEELHPARIVIRAKEGAERG